MAENKIELLIKKTMFKMTRKKKLFSGLFALALLATTAVGVTESRKSEATMSNLAMANVEALANGESGGRDDCKPGDDICCEFVKYSDGGYGFDCLLDHEKAPGWL